MKVLQTIPRRSNSQSAIRVRAYGDLNGWYFVISDTNRNVLTSDFGPLPRGFKFNESTALLFSLAQASRCVDAKFPACRVVMINTTQPAWKVQRRRAAA